MRSLNPGEGVGDGKGRELNHLVSVQVNTAREQGREGEGVGANVYDIFEEMMKESWVKQEGRTAQRWK